MRSARSSRFCKAAQETVTYGTRGSHSERYVEIAICSLILDKRYFLFAEYIGWSNMENSDERWSKIMPTFERAYRSVKEDQVSEEHFILTMKTAFNTFCKTILHASFIPAAQS